MEGRARKMTTGHDLTPVQEYGMWAAKREDLACYIGPDRPSGAKVRQYMAMAAKHPPGTPMVVGCSAHSAQQVYIADAAMRSGAKGYIFIPARKTPTASTAWCRLQGSEVYELRPGWPTQYRSRARMFAKSLGGCIRWDTQLAVLDTADQCANLPSWCTRVLVPTGSGLTAAGVMVGLARQNATDVTVHAYAVSDMAKAEEIIEVAKKNTDGPLSDLTLTRCPLDYGKASYSKLPSGETLDPYYAAKAYHLIEPGDVFWVSGRRPEGL